MQRVELSLWNRILRTFNVFLVIYGFKCGFPGLLVSGDSRKIRVVAKLGRLVRSNVVVGLVRSNVVVGSSDDMRRVQCCCYVGLA